MGLFSFSYEPVVPAGTSSGLSNLSHSLAEVTMHSSGWQVWMHTEDGELTGELIISVGGCHKAWKSHDPLDQKEGKASTQPTITMAFKVFIQITTRKNTLSLQKSPDFPWLSWGETENTISVSGERPGGTIEWSKAGTATISFAPLELSREITSAPPEPHPTWPHPTLWVKWVIFLRKGSAEIPSAQ